MDSLNFGEKTKYIFVVLVYRNAEDLYDFNRSLKNLGDSSYRVVIVNSFMDVDTEERIKEIANELNYSFVSFENKGYGFGNNNGISYVNENFNYDYLIICNSDVIIEAFDDSKLPEKNAVVGPKLTTINGKSQNPYWAFRNNPMERLIYQGLTKKSRVDMCIAQGTNKLIREAFLLFFKNSQNVRKVYALHGSFIIFSKDVIQKTFPLFDTSMYLYYEEAFLARKLSQLGIPIYYYSKINVLHKEDGSTKGLNIDLNNFAVQSFRHYYETYVLGKEK